MMLLLFVERANLVVNFSIAYSYKNVNYFTKQGFNNLKGNEYKAKLWSLKATKDIMLYRIAMYFDHYSV